LERGIQKSKISRQAAKPPRKSRKEDYEDYSGSPLINDAGDAVLDQGHV
jgi:hypothetical protein